MNLTPAQQGILDSLDAQIGSSTRSPGHVHCVIVVDRVSHSVIAESDSIHEGVAVADALIKAQNIGNTFRVGRAAAVAQQAVAAHQSLASALPVTSKTEDPNARVK